MNNSTRGETRVLLVALNRKCLSWTRLSVCKDTNVEAVNCTLNKSLTILEYLVLRWILIEDSVEVVVLRSISIADSKRHLISLNITLNVCLRVILFFFRKWPDATVDTNFTFHIFELVEQLFSLGLLLLVLGGYLIELCCALLELLFY